MTILSFLALALRAGDKVHITFSHKKDDARECDAYFGGFRHYGKGLLRDFLDIYPVFYEAKPDGSPSRRLLHGRESWSLESFLSITSLTPLRMTPEAVSAICDLKSKIDRTSHEMLVEFMADYAKCHPGRPKIFLDPDDGVSVKLDQKYCSYTGGIVAVSFIDGKIYYDISTQMELNKDVPDYRDVCRCGAYVEDETYLLKKLYDAKKEPYFPNDDENFFDYIKPGVILRWNDVPDYIERFKKPGPTVMVVSLPGDDNVITPDTIVTVRMLCDGSFEDGMEVTVKAGELEPLEQ